MWTGVVIRKAKISFFRAFTPIFVKSLFIPVKKCRLAVYFCPMNNVSYRTATYLLLAVWLLISALFYGKSIGSQLGGHHAWAMADYYAMSLKFAENGLNLFCPQTYNLGTKDGITASDLPLPAWLTGVVMRLSGIESPAVFRVLSLCVGFLGFFFFFKAVYEQGVSPFRSVILTLFLWLLPGLLYYHDNFLPSVWALSAFLIGLWALLRTVRGDNRYWVIAVGAFVLAALLRKPYILQLMCVGVWQVLFRRDKKKTMVLAAGAGVFMLWQLYDFYLMQAYGSIFLRQTMQPQDLTDALRLGTEAVQKWGLTWLSLAHVAWLVLAALMLFFRPKQAGIPFFAWYFWGTFGVGLAYFLLMLRQFSDHDYYFIDSFYPVVFVGVLGWAKVIGAREWVVKVELGLLVLASWTGFQTVQWYNGLGADNVSRKTQHAYAGSDKVFDRLGIPRDAKVMVFEAYSSNLPLIGLRRNGYCLLNSAAETQQKVLDLKPDYAVCLDTNFVSDVVRDNPNIVKNLEYVGRNSDLWVFRPGNFPENTLENLLGKDWTTLADSSASTAEEFIFAKTLPVQAGAKILFYGNLQTTEGGTLKATVALFKSGAPVIVLERPLRIPAGEKPTFSATSINVPTLDADEMRLYLWNPEHLNVAADNFKLVQLRFTPI